MALGLHATKRPRAAAAARRREQTAETREPREAARVRAAVLALVGVQLLLWGLLVHDEFFRIDDYAFFAYAKDLGPWSLDWLDKVQWEHWGPLHRLTFSLLDHASLGSWAAVVAFDLLLFGIGLLAFYGSLERLFGRSWWLLAPVAAVGASMQFAAPFSWPSNGVYTFPEFAGTTVGLYGYLRYHETRRRRWLVLSLAALAIGSLFYVRTFLGVLVIALVRLLFLEPRPTFRALRRERLAWLAYAALVAAYLANYLPKGVIEERPPFTASELGEYVRLLWLHNVPPRMLGVEVGEVDLNGVTRAQGELTAWEIVVLLLAQATVAGAVLWTVWRKRAAWRGWAFIAICFAATIVLMSVGRLGELGPEIGLDHRYATHLPWLICVGALYAFHPRTRLRPGAAWPHRAEPARAAGGRRRTAVAAAAAVAVAVTSLLNLWEGRAYLDRWPGEDTRLWVTAAQSSLKEVAASNGRPVVRNGYFPDYVFSWRWGRVRVGPLAPGVGLQAEFTSNAVPTAHIGDDGRAFPVAYVTGHRYALERAAVRHALAPRGMWRRSGAAWCIDTPPSRGTYLEARLPRPVRGHETVVLADAAEPLPGQGLAVFPDSGRGYPRRARATMNEYRAGEAVAVIDRTELSGVRLVVPAATRVCMRSLEIGATRAAR